MLCCVDLAHASAPLQRKEALEAVHEGRIKLPLEQVEKAKGACVAAHSGSHCLSPSSHTAEVASLHPERLAQPHPVLCVYAEAEQALKGGNKAAQSGEQLPTPPPRATAAAACLTLALPLPGGWRKKL